jgi:Rod binding domain-containing protein
MNIQNTRSTSDGNQILFSKLNAASNLPSASNLQRTEELGSDFAAILNSARTVDNANTNFSSGINEKAEPDSELRESFNDFVGQTFFGQLLSSMRSTQGEAPYFNGGRAEKIFQGQLDQVLTEELSESSASKIADPMFKLFQAYRA